MAPAQTAVDASLLKALHFMMLKHDLARSPGQYRPGAVWVQNDQGEAVYHAPDRALPTDLLDELTSSARDGLLAPEFSSIEEYLGANTSAYYSVLTEVAQGSWSPHRDARPWVEFCLTAHNRQATTLLRRVQEAEALWDGCEQLVAERRMPDRSVAALCDLARGWRMRRSFYVKVTRTATGIEVSDAAATRDLAGWRRPAFWRQWVKPPAMRCPVSHHRQRRPPSGGSRASARLGDTCPETLVTSRALASDATSAKRADRRGYRDRPACSAAATLWRMSFRTTLAHGVA